jgi:hypothetical protein
VVGDPIAAAVEEEGHHTEVAAVDTAVEEEGHHAEVAAVDTAVEEEGHRTELPVEDVAAVEEAGHIARGEVVNISQVGDENMGLVQE